jgi:peptide/nickel transport system ATP-binding protein
VTETNTLLDVDSLTVSFRFGGRLFSRSSPLVAVKDVSFQIARGETFALVGESGSGKSTTARAVMRLIEPDGGRITLGEHDLTALSRRQFRPYRKWVQMVFQDPYSSLDPSMIVSESVAEPLLVHSDLNSQDRHERVAELFNLVGLSSDHLGRYPYEFSGGQRQRLAIARAIACDPDLVICDEAVSALDVSTQNQIINLLEDLQDKLGVSYLFISHDLAVVRYIAQQVAVMYLGNIVEHGPVQRIFGATAHPYTQALLSAVPVPDPARSRDRKILRGDVPDPMNPPSGCPFSTRCEFVMDVCKERMPPMTPVEGGGEVACWLQTDGPVLAGKPLRQEQD